MNNEKMIAFVKRWREIERQQKDLDFQRSRLARDIRAEFEKGDRGDDQFCNWCVIELGITAFQARELLTRAVAATIVPDDRTWKMIGGYRAIRPLQGLPRKHQVDVLEAAKSSGRAPINIMRERGLAVSASKPQQQSAYTDAVTLAQFISRTSKHIPEDILAIVSRYANATRRAS